MSTLQQHKIVLLGDGGVGKSAYIGRLLTGEFTKNYVATLGVEVHPLTFYTNRGKVIFNLWDTAGQEKFSNNLTITRNSLEDADGIIVMFDVTSKLSYKSVEKWVQLARSIAPNAPIVLCGNKVDIADRKIKARNITAHRKLNLSKYIDLSARSCFNFEAPFKHFLRCFHGDDIEMVPEPLELI